MKRIAMVLCLVMFAGTAFAGVVEEAKGQISKEKHEALVRKAKDLLNEKASLEEKLSGVKEKLKKLECGEDTETDSDVRLLTYGTGTITVPAFRSY